MTDDEPTTGEIYEYALKNVHAYLRHVHGAHFLDESPPYPSPTTDPVTERMRQETGHDCITCPGDVRNLMATTHNLLVKLDAGDWAGVARQREAVREALAKLRPVSDAHFDALNAWRRP